jgi:hypothetical protein
MGKAYYFGIAPIFVLVKRNVCLTNTSLELGVIATFWPNEEMGRNQDGLGGYTCNVLMDRPCAWIWAKLPVYLYIMVEYDSV